MIGIADCNSFYCSCERVFEPKLFKMPVVVLSNNDGCIVSRTDEAKKLGINMAVPYFQCKEEILRNDVSVFSSNYHLYGDMSQRVMSIFKNIMGEDCVEVYSVDEAFIDFRNTPDNEIYDRALYMKEYTEQCTGIPICVGVSKNKLLSKVANKLAKKNKVESKGVMVLSSNEEIASALEYFDVSDIWGIGGRFGAKLKMMGVDTALKLRNMPLDWAKKNLGGVVGERLVRQLRGEEVIEMNPPLKEKKQIATTRMFGRNVTELRDLEEAIATYTSRAAEKLRRQFSTTGEIGVFLLYQDKSYKEYVVKSSSHYMRLPVATSDTFALVKAAIDLLQRIYYKNRIYKKGGVMFSNIVPDSSLQGNLFEPGNPLKRSLMSAIDNINSAIGPDTVSIGTAGINKNWKMRQELRSKKFTTDWYQIKEVS